MLALIAGRGALPRAVKASMEPGDIVCGLAHCPPDQVQAERLFHIERLGDLLHWLRNRGVTQVCLCGGITRPDLSVFRLGLRTLPMVPALFRALRRGDDGALRIAIDILERAGFEVLAAQDIAPYLLPPAGVPTRVQPPAQAAEDARLGDRVSAEQGRRDLGQASILRDGGVIAREGEAGTDAMIRAAGPEARGSLLFKAPKPGQDRRADLPVIGPQTVTTAAAAGLSGIVIEAGGVIVLDRKAVVTRLDDKGMFLWIRERGA